MSIPVSYNINCRALWNVRLFMQFFAISLFVSMTSAIHILAPGSNATLIKGETQSISWSAVNTDPSTFSLYLVNFIYWPPTLYQLKRDIPTTDRTVQFMVPCDIQQEDGWQLNAINGTNTYIIYAQSERFLVTGNCENSNVAPITNSCITVPAVCKIT